MSGMNFKNTERVKLPAVGGSSLLVIFTVLCLTIFALLGIETVRANCRLTDAAAESVISYYNADEQAESILAQLREGTVPQGVERNGELYTYACPVSDRRALLVQVRIGQEDYEILRWQTVATTAWETDEKLNVWSGS